MTTPKIKIFMTALMIPIILKIIRGGDGLQTQQPKMGTKQMTIIQHKKNQEIYKITSSKFKNMLQHNDIQTNIYTPKTHILHFMKTLIPAFLICRDFFFGIQNYSLNITTETCSVQPIKSFRWKIESLQHQMPSSGG